MSLREEDKQAYIQYRVDSSIEALEEAKMAYESGRLKLAVNRNYYACLYSTKALLLTKDVDCSSHSGVKIEFNKQFIKEGLIDKEYSKILEEATEQRKIGDYKDLIKFDKEEVKESFDKAEKFVTEINKISIKFINNQEIENSLKETVQVEQYKIDNNPTAVIKRKHRRR